MALTPSTMLPLGTPAPDFALPDSAGRTWRLEDFAERRALLVVFMCNHCPYVKHVAAGLAALGRDLEALGVGMVGINANDAQAYPDDAPAAMAEEARRRGYAFPYLYDEGQAVARAYRAACTPDLFLFDRQRRLVYRGQLDDSRPGNGLPVTGASVRAAVDALLAGQPVSSVQRPAQGCNIKWRPGNEPYYFAARTSALA